MTYVTLCIVGGLITLAGGDGDVQAAHRQPFRLLEIISIGDVAVGDAIEMDAFRRLKVANRALQVDALPAVPRLFETVAAIPGDIRSGHALDCAGLAIVATFATDGIAGTPLLASFGNAIDCATRAVAGDTGVGLRQSMAVSEFDFAIDMVFRGVRTVAGITVVDARTLVGSIEVAGMGARGECVRRNGMAGAAHATLAVPPLGCGVNRLARLFAAGSAIGVAEAVGAGQINAIE